MKSVQLLHFSDGFLLFYFGDGSPSVAELDPYYSEHGIVIQFTNFLENFEVIVK